MAKVPIGKYPNGKTKYREVRGATQAEVVAKMKTVAPLTAGATVAEWAERWLVGLRSRASTRDDYARMVRVQLLPALGSRRLADVTAADVEDMVRGWTIAPNSVRKRLVQVRTMFTAARRAGLVSVNVAKDVRAPKATKVAINPFTPAELATIIAEASREPAFALFALLAAVGCRIGEGIALDVSDFDGTRVSITKTYSRKFGSGRPKSENGIRTLTVPAVARPALIAAKGTRTKGALFANAWGQRQHHVRARTQWAKLLERCGLPYRNPHQLRHSVASALIAAGCPLPDVARFLGDSVATVVATYLHPSGADMGQAMERVLGAGK